MSRSEDTQNSLTSAAGLPWWQNTAIVDITDGGNTITLKRDTNFTFSPGFSKGNSTERRAVTLVAGVSWYAPGDALHLPSSEEVDHSRLRGFDRGEDKNFGLSGNDLVELQCQDGITTAGYDALGMDLSFCLSKPYSLFTFHLLFKEYDCQETDCVKDCIRSSKPGAKTSDQLFYWSNICDLAWRTSTSAALDVLGKTYVKIPDGQVSCTNNALSAATIPIRPHATATANNNDSPQTNRQAIDTPTKTQEDGVAPARNIQTLSQNRGTTTHETDQAVSPLTTSGTGGQSSQTIQAAATPTQRQRKKRTKKCKNDGSKPIGIGFSKASLGLMTITVGAILSGIML
ncbi:hypothetical protein L486_01936 [Kwoniella mangroviensis CBS 10435]|uniref:Uncharacterized protein n=1 Tax=Kwoniella mangroviensis CBS 10435 TaxID=1331196 RepID=A0A1B9J3B2_9TREE|nr:hypothetical protein L486_01936 [Kwoniella mangroviensis CBS 10435]